MSIDLGQTCLQASGANCEIPFSNGWKIEGYSDPTEENSMYDESYWQCAKADRYVKCYSTRSYGPEQKLEPIPIPQRLEPTKAHSIVMDALSSFQETKWSTHVRKTPIAYDHVQVHYKSGLGSKIKIDVQVVENKEIHIRCQSTFENLKEECNQMRERILAAFKGHLDGLHAK